MTDEEIAIERKHIIETRLGVLCGAGQPTKAQMNLARKEAFDWEDEYRLRSWTEKPLTSEPQ